jgi:hypothetical protein
MDLLDGFRFIDFAFLTPFCSREKNDKTIVLLANNIFIELNQLE